MMSFIIHYHSAGRDHYDLMFEKGESLETWRIDVKGIDLLLKGETIRGVKLPPHRKEYLSYEGPVSCDRGTVTAYDDGIYHILIWNMNYICISLSGKKIKGILNIDKINDINYTIKFISNENNS